MTCFEGTPAEKAGLLPGDILYSVNDIEVTGKDLTDVVSLIKTAKGDTVHLTIAREGEKDYLEPSRRWPTKCWMMRSVISQSVSLTR